MRINDCFKCDKTNCHGNVKGLCHVLTEPIKGKACPFYKDALTQLKELAVLENRPIDWERYRQLAESEYIETGGGSYD